jgi:hypothetical protein
MPGFKSQLLLQTLIAVGVREASGFYGVPLLSLARPCTVGLALHSVNSCYRNSFMNTRARSPPLRMISDGVEGEDGFDRRIEQALSSRLVNGSAGLQIMPMSRAERRAYEALGEELMDAIRDNDVPAVERLCVEKGADPAFSDEFGFSCLHLAAKRGYLEVVRALCDQGADVNQEGEGGTIPLHMAAQFGHLALVQSMIELGADVDAKDGSGSTPLRLAQMFGRKEVEQYLRPLVDTGSGRWSKEDAQAREQTIYDDTTFPWDAFLRENQDQIVVDMEDEDEDEDWVERKDADDRPLAGDKEGRVDGEPASAWHERGSPFGGESGAVLDVASEEVGKGAGGYKEAEDKGPGGGAGRGRGLEMSDQLRKQMDLLFGEEGAPEVVVGPTVDGGPTVGGGPNKKDGGGDGRQDKIGGGGKHSGVGRAGDVSRLGGEEGPEVERPRAGGPELDEVEEEMILQSAVDRLLREMPKAERLDATRAQQLIAAIKREGSEKRRARDKARGNPPHARPGTAEEGGGGGGASQGEREEVKEATPGERAERWLNASVAAQEEAAKEGWELVGITRLGGQEQDTGEELPYRALHAGLRFRV